MEECGFIVQVNGEPMVCGGKYMYMGTQIINGRKFHVYWCPLCYNATNKMVFSDEEGKSEESE